MRGLAGLVVAVALGLLGVDAVYAAPPLVDGKTSAVYDYTQAVRERVFIPQPGIDTDNNGVMDWVTADIIRPDTAEKVPAIMVSSMTLTTFCQRRTDQECMADWDADGRNDSWAGFYDNYFVPRGYAYILGQVTGTGYTEHGCSLWYGPTDVAGQKSIIDWLNGRVPGYAAASVDAPPRVVSWHNGSSALIGGGPDSAWPNAVAATGVEGLKTIVPMNGLSSAYGQFHINGVLGNLDTPVQNRVAIALDQVTQGNAVIGTPPGVNLPARGPICMFTRQFILNDANTDLGDGDAHGDINTFWRERDWVKDASKVKAAVFAFNGANQNEVVRLDQLSAWWEALKVPRKLWLARAANVDPFAARRAEWVDTIHRWFDHWLYGIENGIMSEPPVAIEDEGGTWSSYPEWPVPGARGADVYLRAGADAAGAGTLGAITGGSRDTLTYTTASTPEDSYISNPSGAQTNRRVFLSAPLTRDVRLSGTPIADLRAALGGPQTNLGVVIADYGPSTQVSRTGEGLIALSTRSCWGPTTVGDTCRTLGEPCTPAPDVVDDACYPDYARARVDVTQWRVTRGVLDSSNRDSLWFQDASPVLPGQSYRFRFPVLPVEYTVRAGHRIGIILTGHHGTYAGPTGTLNVPVTVDTRASNVTLPVVGGPEALVAAGLFDDPTAPVGGSVPPTLALSLGAPATFGAFTPGVTRDYTASTTATVISTAGDAALSSSDPGHLTNGPFALPQPLQVAFTKSAWTAPVSNESVTVDFRQSIGAGDALRTGPYSKTLTFTLSTTTP
jgi:X-Pro dipeptidyl-peptidase